jgi:hypothetical protein
MTTARDVPTDSYGVLQRSQALSALDEATEQVRNLGYAVIESTHTTSELRKH